MQKISQIVDVNFEALYFPQFWLQEAENFSALTHSRGPTFILNFAILTLKTGHRETIIEIEKLAFFDKGAYLNFG